MPSAFAAGAADMSSFASGAAGSGARAVRVKRKQQSATAREQRLAEYMAKVPSLIKATIEPVTIKVKISGGGAEEALVRIHPMNVRIRLTPR